MKRKFGILVTLAICLSAIVFIGVNGENENSQITKYVGSDDYIFIKEEVKDISVLAENADIIVSGYAVDSGKTIVKSGSGISKEIDEKYKDLYGKEIKTDFTNTTFVIIDVYYGDATMIGEEIIISQYGRAGNDKGENKLKINKEVILLLNDMGEGIFSVEGLENGAFTIEDDGTINTHGNDEAVIKFDKKDKSNLIDVLVKIKKK